MTTREEFAVMDKDEVIFIRRAGGLRMYHRAVLEAVPSVEEWETAETLTHRDGVISVAIGTGSRAQFVPYPHPDLRFHEVNGVTVLQRRVR